MNGYLTIRETDDSVETLYEIQKSRFITHIRHVETEEEARAILEDYQNYLMTNDGGKMAQFLDYMTEQYATRDDFIF